LRRALHSLAGFLLLAGPLSAQDERDLPRERSEWNARFRLDESGRVLSKNRTRALAEAARLPLDGSMRAPGAGTLAARETSASWQALGPQPIRSKVLSDRNWGDVSGRVDALAIHPSNPSVLLLGGATGGIWKSTDAGATWRGVSDSAPSLAISSIAFAPSNSSIVFATTGELDEVHQEGQPSRSLGTYLGAGLLKSTDTGETWSRVDTNLPENAILSRVVVDPTNPQNVVVGIYEYEDVAGDGRFLGGIYRSTNGGVTFSRIYGHQVTDLAQDPNDSNRIYMAASNFDCTICPSGGVYVSTDFGQSWAATLAPASVVSNPKIGVSRSNPTAVYASLLDSDDSHAGADAGIYVSLDAGKTWTKKSADAKMCPADDNQCNYDHWIASHPTNPSIAYFGSIDIYKTMDGGQTWSKVTDQYVDGRPEPVHPDQHACLIVPSNPNTIYFGNDGGMYKTSDGGATFQNLNASLALTQIHRINLHPTDPSLAFGSTQDNGNIRYSGFAPWADVSSGDGGFALFRRDAPSEAAGGHYYAYLQYSTDGGVTFNAATPCGTLMDCDKGTGLDPMAFYPPATAPPNSPGTLFFGTNRIWVNPTFGKDPAAWTARSATKVTNSHFTALAAAGDGNGAFWTGTVTGSVFFSTDGGQTFTPRFTGLPAAVVTSIVLDSADGRSAYVTFGGFLGSPSRHIFYTSDAGETWTNLSSNLPDVPVLSLAVNPADTNDLFVGTDVGVFRNPPGSSDWFAFNQGLPAAAPVYALAFSSAGELHAGTYGRGAFKINLGGGTGPCVAGAGTLCLNGGRFRVQVSWRVPSQGTSGSGVAVPLTGDTGYFWFFSSNNIELVLKVVDGRAVNGRFWVFYGALSNVEYTITVTDTVTGTVKIYTNPSGQLASVADTNAFPGAMSPEPPQFSLAAPAFPGTGRAGFAGTAPLPVFAGRKDPGVSRERETAALAAPNLLPYKPSLWSDRIVVSRTPGTQIDSVALSPSDPLFVSWAVLNAGDLPTAVRFYTDLYVDGVFTATWYADPPLSPNFYGGVLDFPIGTLPAGVHTLRINTDSTGSIFESNEADNEYTRTITVSGGAQPCVPGAFTLCLNGGRFKVQVSWRVPSQGTSGSGNAVSLTGDTGYLWFFSSNNIELVIKVVDGRAVNGRFWVFYGALSNVEYTITITDTQTGAVKTYTNPSGQLASVADTLAF
jgi:photosystem II stability/assembly factor-like uncharacterized protein